MDLNERIADAIVAHQKVIEKIRKDHTLINEIERASLIISESLFAGGAVLTFGNGGSAADAQHIVAELVGRFFIERDGFRAIDLSSNSSIITSLSNDFGYDEIFSRQIIALGNPGDVAIAISTSGKSPSVLNGIEAAKEKGLQVIGFTGKDGGSMPSLCDVAILIPSQDTPHIQEAHVLIYHIMCGLVEQAVCEWQAK